MLFSRYDSVFLAAFACLALTLAGCGGGNNAPVDSGVIGDGSVDTGYSDAGSDAGYDAGHDAGSGDASVMDSAVDDASTMDGAVDDASTDDASTMDGAVDDASTGDASTGDASTDAGTLMCDGGTVTVVSDGTMLTGEDSSGSSIDFTGGGTGCTSYDMHHTVYYQATVPAGATLQATVSNDTDFDAIVAILPMCGADTCLTHADSGVTGDPETATWSNAGTSDATVLIAVGAYGSSSTGGTFDLSVSLPMASGNGVCSAPTSVTDGTMLTGQDVTVGLDDLSGDCLFSDDGPNVYYQVTVPAGMAVSATATPDSTMDATIRVLDSCSATSCMASTNAGGVGEAETVQYFNSGSTDQTVLLAVGATDASSVGTFDLSVSFTSPTGNGVCSAATMVSDGTSLTGEDVTMGLADLSSDCLSGAHGPNVYYQVTVPDGMVLTATATPDTWDATIRLLDSCSATSCLGSADAHGSGTAETLTYTNVSGADQMLTLAVGAYSSSSVGNFDLAVSVAPPPYTESSIAAACDDMSGATVVSGVDADDSYSAAAALPFSIDVLGDTMMDYWVSSNGLMALETTPADPTLSYSSNSALPNTGDPMGVVAPLWDDLAPPSTGTSSVSTKTFGSSPNRHFTVEWTNWAFYGATDTTALTFQVQLYETTNIIEFHYCSLTDSASGTKVTGSSATVGVENADNSSAYQHSYNTAGSVTSGMAIRLTP